MCELILFLDGVLGEPLPFTLYSQLLVGSGGIWGSLGMCAMGNGELPYQ